MIPLAIVPASAQQTNDLQQQVDQLKKEYEQNAQATQDLRQRIAALEKQIEDQKSMAATGKAETVSAAQLAAEQEVKKTLFGGFGLAEWKLLSAATSASCRSSRETAENAKLVIFDQDYMQLPWVLSMHVAVIRQLSAY